MTDIAFWPATKLIRALRARKIGALELLEHYAARIEKYDGALNAFCVLDLEAARKRARAFDRAQAKKGARPAPLAGLPMSVKESFDLAGHPTTWGVADYRLNRARRDALAVERLARAGANVFGKTNVPVMLADWETNNPVYGRTGEPLGPVAHPRRLLRRRRGRARRWPHRAGNRQRHRRLDPQPGALLRRLRPQADLRHLLARGPRPARQRAPGRHLGDRPARARRGRPRARAVDHRRAGRDRRRRLEARPARAAAQDPARAARRGRGHAPDRRDRRERAGRDRPAGEVPRRQGRQGVRSRAARVRLRRGAPRLHPAPARRDLGAAGRTTSSPPCSPRAPSSIPRTSPTTRRWCAPTPSRTATGSRRPTAATRCASPGPSSSATGTCCCAPTPRAPRSATRCRASAGSA